MTEPEKVNLESLDIARKKREQLKELFPEVFSEDKVDFDQLKRVLGEWVEPTKERFGLNWPGKAECMKIIQQSSIATLKPARDESVNFDDTENLFIEGDNLEVLKLLQKSYFGKVKMIYIDPPYNTGKEFIYPDKFSETLDTYLEYTGQKDSEGRKFSTNTDAAGRYHSNWLNMMYPRLYLSRNLLSEIGVFVTHIDEHEAIHLQLLLDEIYGSENCIGVIAWDKKNPKGDTTKIAYQHETILVYAKNIEAFREKQELKRAKDNAEKMLSKAQKIFQKLGKEHTPHELNDVAKKYGLPIELSDYKKPYTLVEVNEEYKEWLKGQDISGGESAYKHIDENGDVFQSVSMAWPNKKQAPDDYFIPLIHPVTKKPCPVPDRGWRNPPDTMKELLSKNLVVFGSDETTQPRRKYLLRENMDENIPSILPYGGSDDALLTGLEIPFDNPKPVKFASQLLEYFMSNEDNIILDFFAGSGTTAHAVMALNKEDGGNRKFICVQLPESTDEKSKAYKAGYKTIADISKERIRRAAKKFEEGHDGQLDLTGSGKLDHGFKVFKLDKSNFKVWEGDVEKIENLERQLFDHVDHINDASSPEDILYELLLKAGFPLTTKVEKITMANKDVFSIEDGVMLICLNKELDQAVIDAMAEADPLQVICLDEGFKGNDQLKANAVQAFKARSREEESEIVFKTV